MTSLIKLFIGPQSSVFDIKCTYIIHTNSAPIDYILANAKTLFASLSLTGENSFSPIKLISAATGLGRSVLTGGEASQ